MPIPVGSEQFVEDFLLMRAEATRHLAERIAELPRYAPPALPAVQAASCMLRECIPQRSNHLLRVLATSQTGAFAEHVDSAVAEAAVTILDFPDLAPWQRVLQVVVLAETVH